MPSPTYQVNKPYQIAYQKRNKELTNVRRMISYYKNKDEYYKIARIFRRILI